METPNEMEERLWNFIDGRASAEEQSLIRELIGRDAAWERLYRELLEVNQLLHAQELEMPSMRFTKNVMEEIARFQVAPATKTYINKNIIRGLTAFFLLMIGGILVYFLGQVHWVSNPTDTIIPKYNIDAGRINWGKALNSTAVNIFILVNVVLGFILLDKFLQSKKAARS